MPLEPKTLALLSGLGIEVAGPDDPIYRRGWTITPRPGRAITRDPDHQRALDRSAELVRREAIETMKAYCRPPEKDEQ